MLGVSDIFHSSMVRKNDTGWQFEVNLFPPYLYNKTKKNNVGMVVLRVEYFRMQKGTHL